ncbi:MAG: EamA family transporter [Promethearchaeota archaeon]
MQNKYIFYIIASNILWSFIPVIVSGLFNEVSIIMIIFLRFFVSGIILFFLALLFLWINNKYTPNKPISLKQLLKFTLSKNEDFFNLRNILYFTIMGFFGIILQIIFYFLALKITTISITMIGFLLSIIIIAFYEHGAKAEKLDVYKSLYIIMLIFSIIIIIYVKTQESTSTNIKISSIGFLFVILFTSCLTFFHLIVVKDSYTKDEIKVINKNENYKIPRLLIKISLTFLIGIALMVPLILFLYIIPIKTELTPEINQFFTQILNINIYFRWEILFLIIFSTITPYLLLFIAYVKWNPYNLTYRQWNSILTTIEPIGGIFFGVILGIEPFPLLFLAVVLFLLTISIFLRYVHESTNKINACLLLKRNRGTMKDLSIKLLKYNDIYCVESLIGTYDLILNVKSNSIKDFYYLVNNKLRKLKEIKNIKILFINKINKISKH